MDLSLLELDSGQREFAEEARAFFAEHVTEEVLEEERLTGNVLIFFEDLELTDFSDIY